MAAPKRRTAPVRPKARPTGTPALAGGVVEGMDAPSESITLVKPKQNLNRDDLMLMKLSQIVMMGIGFLSIWGGVFSVAFDEDATNQNFLVLFVGGLA